MRELFPILPRPSRYLGIEEGVVCKDKASLSLHVALAFPDMYEVGMSYLGQKILAYIVNEQPGWWAERVFAPCPDAGRILKEQQAPLCTLESDTPLAGVDVIGFSVTHELCYTNILYMLDLAGIPLRAEDRKTPQPGGRSWPIIVAGGGCSIGAEPLAPFMDIMALGEGEACLPELLRLLEKCRSEQLPRHETLLAASRVPGMYIPEFFAASHEGKHAAHPSSQPWVTPLHTHHTTIHRQIVAHMDDAVYPLEQAIPFGAVHNRLALEIARGCTRGCRFCQAGILYRPARERSVLSLQKLLDKCLATTGYDDVSFLSLSTGDYSALRELSMTTIDRCAREQISVSLPSLRVGSIDDSIMEKMAGIRRTGATLAPEAGSQRLRDVINKGVTEEELILHIQKLYEHGWQQVKLYFMLGLPSETDEDVLAILDLCRKARDAAGPGVKGLQITAALSPFVPKAYTPFQWEAQISPEEIHRRVGLLLSAVKGEKRIKLRWHDPAVSFLEGIFSRGDRRLAAVVESVYRKGGIFPNWMEHFTLEPWLESLAEHGLTPEEFTGPRDLQSPLPWDHMESGVSKAFLLREREKAFAAKTTTDCRYTHCHVCGVCDTKNTASLLHEPAVPPRAAIINRLNQPQRDQEAHHANLDERGRVIPRFASGSGKKEGKQLPPQLAAHLTNKAAQWRIWYSRRGNAVYLSQLELQSIFDRVFRKAGLALTFSQGYHPLPLVSFGRALPVGVASSCEWVSLFLAEKADAHAVRAAMNMSLPRGLQVEAIEPLTLKKEGADALLEVYHLQPAHGAPEPEFFAAWENVGTLTSIPWQRETKKGVREHDARLMLSRITMLETPQSMMLPVPPFQEEDTVALLAGVLLEFDWSQSGYVSPLALTAKVLEVAGYSIAPSALRLTKLAVKW